jgi:acyl CoA:acetate/3-ketoacid CoA transferase beta subunit
MVLVELQPGISLDDVTAATEARFIVAEQVAQQPEPRSA